MPGYLSWFAAFSWAPAAILVASPHALAQLPPRTGGPIVIASAPASPAPIRSAQESPRAVPNAARPVSGKSPGGEGITVHGFWKLDLKNGDGTVAQHREFENSLQSSANLLQILAGKYTVGDLAIGIDTIGSRICAAKGAAGAGTCEIVSEPGRGVASTGICGFSTCIYTLTKATDPGSGAITLFGTVPVVQVGLVTGVGTTLTVCVVGPGPFSGLPSSIAPRDCFLNQSSYNGFTGGLTGISAPAFDVLAVYAGQTLQVTVVLTFS